MEGSGREREKVALIPVTFCLYLTSLKTHIHILLIELNPVLWNTLSS